MIGTVSLSIQSYVSLVKMLHKDKVIPVRPYFLQQIQLNCVHILIQGI